MKLRTKYIEGIGYFAQYKKGFFSRWKTIGKHNNGFGLYPKNNIDYPLNSHYEAKKLCSDFINWTNVKDKTVIYNYIRNA